jgi:polysaccharide pyruvyl transferase WcaK-like protein
VHGVLPALAAGTPSVLLRYDARSAELAETLSVPIFDPAEAIKQSFSDIFGKHHFSKFERMYPINYMNMKAFLEKNDIATRM